MVVMERLRLLFNVVCIKIALLNLFNTKLIDERIVRHEIYSTRLFIILFSISVVIITLYTSLSIHVKTETLTMPTKIQYEQLFVQYSDSLQCPCTQISIFYNEFTRITSSFHQVCSSEFVSQQWIDFVFATNLTFIWTMDVRTSMSAMWQLISALCQYANTTFSDTIDTFSNTSFISPMLISENLLRTQMQASIDLTRQTASDNIRRSFTAVHEITQASGLLTGVSTNFIVPLLSSGWNSSSYTLLFSQQSRYIQSGSTTICYCQSDRSCPNPGNLYLYKS
ncbi:hypothetical protein I4U23_015880 [Adineta vaga]|nr:hypothetical protein I4U23_015880 [Adineta vaga]